MQKHYLITGGAGFIGGHLAEALLARGHCVTAIDNLSTGGLANVAALRGRSDFHFVPYAEAYASRFEDMLRRVADIARLQSLVDWNPSRSRDQILDDVIRHEKAVVKSGA
jgi:nucleoside-diphosphate-sugar epimerase